MSTGSQTRQTETALVLVLQALRKGDGQMPVVTRRAMWEAARILRLDATMSNTWRARADLAPFLEQAGLDKDGRIVDYEKFYAHREAYETKRATKRKRRKDLR